MTRVLVHGASVVDGTGAPARLVDVLWEGDTIVELGTCSSDGAEVVDGRGLVLCPGFVDVHTHYDAQLCWDRLATPSMEHGVTTVVIGNCSLSLAPVRPDMRGRLSALFEQIEDVPAQALVNGVSWNWETFGQYLDVIDVGLGPNVAPLVGHTPLRMAVMGQDAYVRAATPEELTAMCDAMDAAMRAGARGLSVSWLDVDENLKPVPSRLATDEERMALAAVVARHHGVIQAVPNFMDANAQVGAIRLLGKMSRETGVTCSFGPLVDVPMVATLLKNTLLTLQDEVAQGARLAAQTCPRPFDMTLRLDGGSFLLFVLPSWMEVMRLPLSQRLAAFADPANRMRLVFEAMAIAPLLAFARIESTVTPENAPLRGRMLVDVAKERNQLISQTLLEVSVADGLATSFLIAGAWHADEKTVGRLLGNPLVHVGVSDAGAHYAQFCGAGDTTYLLERFVRERGDMTLEHAIHRLTQEPCVFWGLGKRGVVAAGHAADLVLLDADEVARGEETPRADLPGGASRLVRAARGIRRVWVAGQEVLRDGAYTAARPGRVVP